LEASTGAGAVWNCRKIPGDFGNGYYVYISIYIHIVMAYSQNKIKIENFGKEIKKRRVEAFKLIFELLKHLTTLSSGSILILITFIEKILHGPIANKFIKIAFSGFCFSILAALIAMFILAFKHDEEFTDSEKNFFAVTVVLSIATFFAGISSLAYVAFSWL
jgi:hypothetical protein